MREEEKDGKNPPCMKNVLRYNTDIVLSSKGRALTLQRHI